MNRNISIIVIGTIIFLTIVAFLQVNRSETQKNEKDDLVSSKGERIVFDAQLQDSAIRINKKTEKDVPFPPEDESPAIVSRASTEVIRELNYDKMRPLNLPEDKAKAMKLTINDIKELEEKTLIIPAHSDFSDFPSIDTLGLDIEHYNGHYEGDIYWKKSGKEGTVTLNLNGALTEHKMVEGYYEFSADAQGHLEIRISSPGYLGKNIRVIQENPLTLIMEPQGKESKNKIQIFYRVESGQTYLTGIIYSADAKNKAKFEDVAIFKMDKI